MGDVPLEPKHQLITLAKTHPERPQDADRIVGRLADYFAVLPAGFRSPEDPLISVRVEPGLDLDQASRQVLAALEEIDPDWQRHLLMVEPNPHIDER